MGTSQAGSTEQRDTNPYSAQDEINQFMSRFLGFVKTDNSRARTAPEQLGQVGALSTDDLKAALEKIDLVYHCLDVERLKSIQLSIQIEAMNSLHRRNVTADAHHAVSEDLRKSKERCETFRDRLASLMVLNPAARSSPAKIGRIRKAYGSYKPRAKRTGRPACEASR